MINDILLDDFSHASQKNDRKYTQSSKILLLFGIMLMIVGLIDMIILYIIPKRVINKNKNNFPNSTFRKPDTTIIALHFLLHSSLILFGLCISLYGFPNLFQSCQLCKIISIIIISVLLAFFYLFEMIYGFVNTIKPVTASNIESILKIINHQPPLNFSFIYSKDIIPQTDCQYIDNQWKCQTINHNCYSKSGVVFPMFTNSSYFNISHINIPAIFYLNFQQHVIMSDDLYGHFNNILKLIHFCDPQYSKTVEYYPQNTGIYLIVDKKAPKALTKASRISSILFGAAIYYELYSKSIPFIDYHQHVNADIVDGINYNQLFTISQCVDYGTCNTLYPKPFPKQN